MQRTLRRILGGAGRPGRGQVSPDAGQQQAPVSEEVPDANSVAMDQVAPQTETPTVLDEAAAQAPAATTTTSPQMQAAIDAWLAAVPQDQQEEAAANLPRIVQACADVGVTDPNQVAYILATAQHETGFGHERYSRSVSLVEDSNPFTQNADGTWSARNHLTGRTSTAATREELDVQYWNDAYGSRSDLGNREGTNDGSDYRGRGFVQLTGRSNYQSMTTILNEAGYTYTIDGVTYGTAENPIDLLSHPEHVNQVPDLAARILVEGSTRGTFTGKSVGDYINEDGVDFVNARRVINGTDRAADVADIAETYQGAGADWAAALEGGASAPTAETPQTAPEAPAVEPSAPAVEPSAPAEEQGRRPRQRRRRQ